MPGFDGAPWGRDYRHGRSEWAAMVCTYPGSPVGAENPLDALAEIAAEIDAYGPVEPDIEWEPDVAPIRRKIRRAYFPADRDYEIGEAS